MRRTFARYRILLIAYLLPQGGKVALLAVLLLGTIGLQLAGPLIIRSFIDTAIGHGALAVLTSSAALYLAVVLVAQATRVAKAYVAEDVAWTATNALRVDVIRHCLRLDLSFHLARTPGELIERVDGDADTLANFLSRFALTILGNALLVGVLVRQLDRAIARLLRGRMGILIAHRLRTLQRADDILVLEDGRVMEHGSRVDLAADRRSRFAGLSRDDAAAGDRADASGHEDRGAGEPREALR